MPFIAALPMYDWPEVRQGVDARWAALRARLLAAGVAAPRDLVRRNADMPPVPGGIRAADGALLAPDPAMLPPDDLDLDVLWRHPRLLLGETCRGPMSLGLSAHVAVVGQNAYDGIPGGGGVEYRSAVVARRDVGRPAAVPATRGAVLPLADFEGRVLAVNAGHSLSGYLSLRDDLATAGRGMTLFAGSVDTGSHRRSLRAVAAGDADIAAIDCRSWALALRHEPAAAALHVIGWTASRVGLPFITARHTDPKIRTILGGHVNA